MKGTAMKYANKGLFLVPAVVSVLGTACTSINAAPLPTTAESSAGTATTVEIDGGACRLGAISVCPVPTATIPAP
jgi:hypothetical protein